MLNAKTIRNGVAVIGRLRRVIACRQASSKEDVEQIYERIGAVEHIVRLSKFSILYDLMYSNTKFM